MDEWSFLTKHARALICIAQDPGTRLRDIAGELGVTERSAYGIVNDLTAAGYVVKDKDGRRNRYEIQVHLPLRDAIPRERTIGEVLAILVDPRSDVATTSRPVAVESGSTAPTRHRRATPRATPSGHRD